MKTMTFDRNGNQVAVYVPVKEQDDDDDDFDCFITKTPPAFMREMPIDRDFEAYMRNKNL